MIAGLYVPRYSWGFSLRWSSEGLKGYRGWSVEAACAMAYGLGGKARVVTISEGILVFISFHIQEGEKIE